MYEIGSNVTKFPIMRKGNKTDIVGYAYRGEHDIAVLGSEFLENIDISQQSGYVSNVLYTLDNNKDFKVNGLTSNTLKVHYHYRYNKQTLKNLHILVLPYNPKGDFYSALNYLIKLIKQNNYSYYIAYRCVGYDEIVDTTGRTITEIIEQGYRGNRLDLMVNEYGIYLSIKTKNKSIDMHLVERYKSSFLNGEYDLYNDILSLSDKKYNDICFERK